ncbi:hypothetical protein BC937DRAFT_90221 [Endogone sp. FLAS-F59071]|nr:hypothetical protein BC937DRAFT_90221 [Endogone sp. FLAS-F59071]|eukprot:RUS22136.1 hypothetical protein BC937DRAFT_90221 [Endogone sp. FLAS-F59071]
MTEKNVINLSNFIGNEHIPPLHSNYISSPNPAKGEAHLNVPDSSAEDVEKAVQAAEAAFPQWSETKRETRAAILNRIADIIDRYCAVGVQFPVFRRSDPVHARKTQQGRRCGDQLLAQAAHRRGWTDQPLELSVTPASANQVNLPALLPIILISFLSCLPTSSMFCAQGSRAAGWRCEYGFRYR